MKFTLSWLKEHLETNATIDEIVEAMTLAGLEVENVENPAEKLKAFTIAHVTHAEKHPDADKLSVCTVETHEGVKQIVCGAPNARAGIAVAYAGLGAYIPGLDFSLDKVNDPVIDFEVTPNRPDWLGVDNIARDLAAVGLGKLITPDLPQVKGRFPCPVKVTIESTNACPAFTGFGPCRYYQFHHL